MFRAEFYKITKNRSAKLFTLLTIIASALVALLPHYHDFEEFISCMGQTAHVFTLFAAIMIATEENGRGTMKTMISSGMKRSSIYYAKLKVAMITAVFFFLIDFLITLIIDLVILGYPITMGAAAIAVNILFHLLVVVLGAMLYYAAACFISDPIWSVMACLAYFLFAAQALADISNRFRIPFPLDSCVLGGISSYNIMRVGSMQGMGVVINVIIVLVVVLIVPGLIRKRDLR